MTGEIDNARLPFREQIAFYRGKLGNLVPTTTWTDVWKTQHDRAVMVAGAMKADLLSDFYWSVERAISEGKGIGDFRKDFDAIVDQHGWAYEGERNWRSRVIYQTNISTSYAAGREAQIKQAGFPFAGYKHSDSVLHPRPLHESWDGLVVPVNHKFRKTHGCPNGWGCKCRWIGIRNEAMARRLGMRWGDDPPSGWDKIDPKTGEQVGIDKGWGYTPGATVIGDVLQSVTTKQDARPYVVAAPLASGMAREAASSGVLSNWLRNPEGDFPLAVLRDEDMSAIGAASRTVRFSPETAVKQAATHPEISAGEYSRAQAVVDGGRRLQDGTNTLIYVLEEADGYVMAVKATRSGKAVFLTSFRRLSREQAKRDSELRRLFRKEKK